jgi:hypothetical protein
MLADIASSGYTIDCLAPGNSEPFEPQFNTADVSFITTNEWYNNTTVY